MSAQRLALNNFLRSGPRIVSAPHNASVAVDGRDKDRDEQDGKILLVDAVLPYVNFVRNVPLSIDVSPWAPLHKLDIDADCTDGGFVSKAKSVVRDLCIEGIEEEEEETTPVENKSNRVKGVEVSVQTDETITNVVNMEQRMQSLKWELENTRGEANMQAGHHENAFSNFKKASNHGNVIAMRNLAECYAAGVGCKKSFFRAFSWWDRASKAGDVDSLYQLAICHIRGEGTAKSLPIGQGMMRSAAERGNIDAAFYMVTLLFRQNRASEAVPFLRTALLSDEYEDEMREWLEGDGLELPAKLLLKEHLRHG